MARIKRTGPAKVKSNGIWIAYETFGDPDAAPLLLVMGLGMQMVAWDDDFCRQLADRGFWVIRFDNRDIGLSTWFDQVETPSLHEVALGRLMRRPIEPPYRLEDMTADAVGLLDALGIESAHVVGASLGGMIAQLMAIHHPDRVLTLTCIMSRASSDRSAGRPTMKALALLFGRMPADREAYLKRAVRAWKVLSGPVYQPDAARVRARAAVAWDRGHNPTGAWRQLLAEMASGSRIEALHEVRVPTLVIHGDVDPLLPHLGGRQIAAAVAGAELIIVEGMGHALPAAVWPRITEAIARVAQRGEAVRAAAGPGEGE